MQHTELPRRAYIIADSKLALNAGWGLEILAAELPGLMELGLEMEFIGFELPEIDLILIKAEQAFVAVTTSPMTPQPAIQAVTR